MGSNETSAQEAYNQFWPKATEEIRSMGAAGLKHQELPLARIKKIMKLDEDVKMISAEAPVLFAKAAEIFIHELTMRAWIHTEDNKRRTLQRNDIAMAITKYDQFDFLIDIVPRDDIKPTPTTTSKQREDNSVRMAPDQVSYYFQMANQQQPQQPQQGVTPQIINQPATVRNIILCREPITFICIRLLGSKWTATNHQCTTKSSTGHGNSSSYSIATHPSSKQLTPSTWRYTNCTANCRTQWRNPTISHPVNQSTNAIDPNSNDGFPTSTIGHSNSSHSDHRLYTTSTTRTTKYPARAYCIIWLYSTFQRVKNICIKIPFLSLFYLIIVD